MKWLTLCVALLAVLGGIPAHAKTQATYANLSFDVVYARCPRGVAPVTFGTQTYAYNTNGIDDVWIDATNNIHQQPGCDLVLHHSTSDAGYTRYSLGDPALEEVLVNCSSATPECTVMDPNVSFDGTKILYAKTLDTSAQITSKIPSGGGGRIFESNEQSITKVDPTGTGGIYAIQNNPGQYAYQSPTLIFEFNLSTHTSRQVSPSPTCGSPYTWSSPAMIAVPNQADATYCGNIPIIDNGPLYVPGNKIVFSSNRMDMALRFKLFEMNLDGTNLHQFTYDGLSSHQHSWLMKNGQIAYSNNNQSYQKAGNNEMSHFTVNADGSNPFILDGKHDASQFVYHYGTQLSNGNLVVVTYYNHNNDGLGSLLEFPYIAKNIFGTGPAFQHCFFDSTGNGSTCGSTFDTLPAWKTGASYLPFARVGQFRLTPEAAMGDEPGQALNSAQDWLMPDGTNVDHQLRFTHPAAAPNNGLLVTVCRGICGSTFTYRGSDWATYLTKDAGIWYLADATTSIGGDAATPALPTHGQVVVDFPGWQEIQAKAVVPYSSIYDINPHGAYSPPPDGRDSRLAVGEMAGLSGASSLYDRQDCALNGIPWNMQDGGGTMSGRTYSNLGANGSCLAIFSNADIYGVRVLMPEVPEATGNSGEDFVNQQKHHMRILGEYPLPNRRGVLDQEGNPDTSFTLKLPADTPFSFQLLDRNGMAMDMESFPRTVGPGETQTCVGCHYHTKNGIPFQDSYAYTHPSQYGDMTGNAVLFTGVDGNGNITTDTARNIYPTLAAITSRKSFEPDFADIGPVFATYCAICHGSGKSAEANIHLDNDTNTYNLLTNNVTTGTGTLLPAGWTKYQCCLASRWLSFNSAKSSPLVWYMYGSRLDGRDTNTGLPPAGSGVLYETTKEHPDVWDTAVIASHFSLLNAQTPSIPEAEKRLIARWIDIGAPDKNAGDDTTKPVFTTLYQPGNPPQLILGWWDDSAIDCANSTVVRNGVTVWTGQTGCISPAAINLPDFSAADQFTITIRDLPDRSRSMQSPCTPGPCSNGYNQRVVSFSGLDLRTQYANGYIPSHHTTVVH